MSFAGKGGPSSYVTGTLSFGSHYSINASRILFLKENYVHELEEESALQTDSASSRQRTSKVRSGLLIAVALITFLFAIDLMVASLNRLGSGLSEAILFATSNPFNGLFIGLLVTALLQSSSTTTSLVVAFVASRLITVESALPIIMGANIGTTITSTIVSLGFMNKKKEFQRAVASGTYHDMFNILTALIVFPLQYYYNFLGRVSTYIADLIFVPVLKPAQHVEPGKSLFDPVITLIETWIPSGLPLSLLSLVLLFGSILAFRRLVSDILDVKEPRRLGRFLFGYWKSFFWGLTTTAAIRSSTITTSLIVPVVAKKVVTLERAVPFIIGANVGTTITAFIAVSLNATTREAIIIASSHFVFNFVGVLFFLIMPGVRQLPYALANRLGSLTLRFRLSGFVYLLSTFFFVPFILIYLNKDTIRRYVLTYEKGGERYKLSVRVNKRTQHGEWIYYSGVDDTNQLPDRIEPVSTRKNTFMVGADLFLFNRPGFCWDHEREGIRVHTCVEDIRPRFAIAGHSFDSVYVFRQSFLKRGDSVVHRYYFAARERILLLHEGDSSGRNQTLEKLVSFEER